MTIKRKRKLNSLFQKGIFKLEKMLIRANVIDNTVSIGRKVTRVASQKVAATTASIALVAALAMPGIAVAKESENEELETTETPIEMDAESNDVEISQNTPIEVPEGVSIVDETNTVTFTSEDIEQLSDIDLNEGDFVLEAPTPGVTITEVTVDDETTQISPEEEITVIEDENTDSKVVVIQNQASEENEQTQEEPVAEETVQLADLDIETIIPGTNVSENENETKVVIPSDSTYVIFTTADGKQVIWNTESLGNENQDEFISNYNGIADEKIGDNHVFADGYGNIVYADYARDAEGNLILNEDGTVQIIETIVGTMTVDEVTGEKVFVGTGNVNVKYGVNTPKEVKDPNADYDKPVEPTPEEPTPEEPTPEEPKPEGGLVKTGDNRTMIIGGLGAMILGSGLLGALSSKMASRNQGKRLILK